MSTIETETVLFPCGEFEGTPALRVSMEEESDFQSFARAILSAFRPGHQVIWLDRVPWGEAWLDGLVQNLQSTPRFADVPVLSVVSIGAKGWGNAAGVMWIADVSPLLADPVEMATLREQIQGLGFYPELSELVAFRPAKKNLVAAVLDEVHASLRPMGVGWIYDDSWFGYDDQGSLAFRAATSAITPWGVRRA